MIRRITIITWIMISRNTRKTGKTRMTSPLTPSQIEEICLEIPLNPNLPERIRITTAERIRHRLSSDLSGIRIYPALFSSFKQEIVHYYHRTLAASGEAVGIQVAQSIGERQTQSTLNSIDWHDPVLIFDGTYLIQPIGEYIDDRLARQPENIQHIPENRTEYLDISYDDVRMPSVDSNGNTSWLKVEAVTRHLPVGLLAKVTTQSGRVVTATQSKSFLVWDSDEKRLVDRNGSDVRVGDKLPLTVSLPRPVPLTHITREAGNRIGEQLALLSDSFPSSLLLAGEECHLGILEAYFEKRLVEVEDQPGAVRVTGYHSVLLGLGCLLQYINVVGSLATSSKQDESTLTLDSMFAQRFSKRIAGEKIEIETSSNEVADILLDPIVSIEWVEASRTYVYDFTVEKTRNFILLNGLGIRDTFHSSGLSIKTVVVGVPRFSELLNATKSPKMVNCLLYLTESFQDVTDLRERSSTLFTDMTVKRLVESHELIKNQPLEKWHHLFCKWHQIKPDVLGWRLRFRINQEALYEYKVSLKMIADAIRGEYQDAVVLYTPDWVGILDVFVGEECFDEEIEEKVEDLIIQDDISIHEADSEDEDEPTVFFPVAIRQVENREDVVPADMNRVIRMEDRILPALLEIRVCGITGIRDIFFEKRKHEWVVTTEGSNLRGLFRDPLIDKVRTMSNDMWEIYDVFGIEAARQFLIEEYMDIVSSDGTFVNPSNVELLVDIMVYTGMIISISRYGQKKVGCGPMAKASFEESLENFMKAGINGERETTTGVSASIMLGKMPNIGTGVFDLMVDLEKLTKSEEQVMSVPAASVFSTKATFF